MCDSNSSRFRQQVRFLRRQFVQDGNLPFTDVLSEEIIAKALTAIEACWLDRIYSPLVTLWGLYNFEVFSPSMTGQTERTTKKLTAKQMSQVLPLEQPLLLRNRHLCNRALR